MQLYVVTGTETIAGGLGLLPGISQSLLGKPGLGSLQPGSAVELHASCGVLLRVPILSFCVQQAKADESRIALSSLPIVLVISKIDLPAESLIGAKIMVPHL